METPTQEQTPSPAPQATPGRGLAITAMVLGICALASFCCLPLAFLLAVLAIVFGACSLKDGFGKAGFILGLVTVILYIVLYVAGVLTATTSYDFMSEEAQKTSTQPTEPAAQSSASATQPSAPAAKSSEAAEAVKRAIEEKVTAAVTEKMTEVAASAGTEMEAALKELGTQAEALAAELSTKDFEAELQEAQKALEELQQQMNDALSSPEFNGYSF